MARLDTAAKDAVRRAGLEPLARRVLALTSREHRRDAADDARLALLMAFTLRADANCIDIGANVGDVISEMARLAPAGQHFAFEPLPELAESVGSRCPQITVKNLALADEPGVQPFTRVVGAEAYSGLSDRGLSSEHTIEHFDVEVARLDDVLPPDYVPDFIKIDVEGAEFQVLKGARRILESHRPRIWFEHGHTSSGYFGATPNDVWDLLCGELSYRIFDADGRGPLSKQAFFDGPGAPMWSYVAY